MVEKQLMSPDDLRRALTRIAHEVLERNHGVEGLLLVGMHTRGVPLARRLAERIGQYEGQEIPVGALDIGRYRDDASVRSRQSNHSTDIPVSITDRKSFWWTTCSSQAGASARQWTP